MRLTGSDISEYQPRLPGGVDFLICRALGHNEAFTVYREDRLFKQHWANAKGRYPYGRGAYAYIVPGDGLKQAEMFLDIVRSTGDEPELGYWMDIERQVTETTVRNFHDRMRMAGVKFGFYCTHRAYYDILKEGRGFEDLPWWIQDYGPNDGQLHDLDPPPPRPYLIHQYTSMGFDGEMRIDLNIADSVSLTQWLNAGIEWESSMHIAVGPTGESWLVDGGLACRKFTGTPGLFLIPVDAWDAYAKGVRIFSYSDAEFTQLKFRGGVGG